MSSVSVCPCLHLWDSCAASLLVEPANGKAAGTRLHLGRDPGSWAPEAGQEGPGQERLEEAAMHPTSLNMQNYFLQLSEYELDLASFSEEHT